MCSHVHSRTQSKVEKKTVTSKQRERTDEKQLPPSSKRERMKNSYLQAVRENGQKTVVSEQQERTVRDGN